MFIGNQKIDKAVCISNFGEAKMMLRIFSLDNFYIDEGSKFLVRRKITIQGDLIGLGCMLILLLVPLVV